jgi:hypothetical protein
MRSPTFLARTLIVAGAGLLLVVLTASGASACDASYGTKPTANLDADSIFGGTCSTGSSLGGAVVVALLAVAALAALASLAFRRGEQAAAAWGATGADPETARTSTGRDPEATSADQALTGYLNSVGLRDDTFPAQPSPPPGAQP